VNRRAARMLATGAAKKPTQRGKVLEGPLTHRLQPQGEDGGENSIKRRGLPKVPSTRARKLPWVALLERTRVWKA